MFSFFKHINVNLVICSTKDGDVFYNFKTKPRKYVVWWNYKALVWVRDGFPKQLVAVAPEAEQSHANSEIGGLIPGSLCDMLRCHRGARHWTPVCQVSCFAIGVCMFVNRWIWSSVRHFEYQQVEKQVFSAYKAYNGKARNRFICYKHMTLFFLPQLTWYFLKSKYVTLNFNLRNNPCLNISSQIWRP